MILMGSFNKMYLDDFTFYTFCKMCGRYVLYFQWSFKFNILSTTSSDKIAFYFNSQTNITCIVLYQCLKIYIRRKNKLHHVYVFNDAFFMSLTNESNCEVHFCHNCDVTFETSYDAVYNFTVTMVAIRCI